ncbi:serine/threonine protein kinase, putative [Hepatocystis sp. ex Piliocolobus tephrosceles]|nr:serine/threonine protein kinase, putative [Hepatocystis sp. ex Piliocolobus tephrosceles]
MFGNFYCSNLLEIVKKTKDKKIYGKKNQKWKLKNLHDLKDVIHVNAKNKSDNLFYTTGCVREYYNDINNKCSDVHVITKNDSNLICDGFVPSNNVARGAYLNCKNCNLREKGKIQQKTIYDKSDSHMFLHMYKKEPSNLSMNKKLLKIKIQENINYLIKMNYNRFLTYFKIKKIIKKVIRIIYFIHAFISLEKNKRAIYCLHKIHNIFKSSNYDIITKMLKNKIPNRSEKAENSNKKQFLFNKPVEFMLLWEKLYTLLIKQIYKKEENKTVFNNISNTASVSDILKKKSVDLFLKMIKCSVKVANYMEFKRVKSNRKIIIKVHKAKSNVFIFKDPNSSLPSNCDKVSQLLKKQIYKRRHIKNTVKICKSYLNEVYTISLFKNKTKKCCLVSKFVTNDKKGTYNEKSSNEKMLKDSKKNLKQIYKLYDVDKLIYSYMNNTKFVEKKVTCNNKEGNKFYLLQYKKNKAEAKNGAENGKDCVKNCALTNQECFLKVKKSIMYTPIIKKVLKIGNGCVLVNGLSVRGNNDMNTKWGNINMKKVKSLSANTPTRLPLKGLNGTAKKSNKLRKKDKAKIIIKDGEKDNSTTNGIANDDTTKNERNGPANTNEENYILWLKECEYIKENYKILRLLKENTFNFIFKCYDIKNDRFVVIKGIDKKKQLSIMNYNTFMNLYRNIQNINNENIIKIYNILENNLHFFIVMEYCEGTDLVEYVSKEKISYEKAKSIIYQIINGINVLHKNFIIHRDIKLDNIMFKDQYMEKIAIIDFDMSFYIYNDTHEYYKCNNVNYYTNNVEENNIFNNEQVKETYINDKNGTHVTCANEENILKGNECQWECSITVNECDKVGENHNKNANEYVENVSHIHIANEKNVVSKKGVYNVNSNINSYDTNMEIPSYNNDSNNMNKSVTMTQIIKSDKKHLNMFKTRSDNFLISAKKNNSEYTSLNLEYKNKMEDISFISGCTENSKKTYINEGDKMYHSDIIIGTKEYMSPLCLNGQYSMRTDIYSLGVTVFLIIFKNFPYLFEGQSLNKWKEEIINKNKNITIPFSFLFLNMSCSYFIKLKDIHLINNNIYFSKDSYLLDSNFKEIDKMENIKIHFDKIKINTKNIYLLEILKRSLSLDAKEQYHNVNEIIKNNFFSKYLF